MNPGPFLKKAGAATLVKGEREENQLERRALGASVQREDVLDVLLPLSSVLPRCWLNVRGRRRTYVDDLFNQAIADVADAKASVNYITHTPRLPHLSDEEYLDLEKWVWLTVMKNWASKSADANAAVARVLPYQPAVLVFLPKLADGGQ